MLKKSMRRQMRCRAHRFTKMLFRKSQMQMQETIAVLAAVFVIAIIAFSLYYNLFINAAKDEQKTGFDIEIINIAQSISFLPELQCSNNGATSNNCVDVIKAMAAASLINDSKHSSYYFGRFGFSTVTINEAYPASAKVTLYNKTLESYSYKSAINLPILIFYPLEERYSFGVISFEAFLK